MSSSSDSFFILEPFATIPADGYMSWLGRIVKNFQDPKANFLPESIDPSWIPHWEDLDDYTNVEVLLKVARGSLAAVALQGLFSVSKTQDRTTNQSLKQERVRHVRLWQEEETLSAIIKDEAIQKKLGDWLHIKLPVYWIVGFLVSENVNFGQDHSTKNSTELKVETPINEITTAITGSPAVLKEEPLKGEYKKSTADETKLRATTGPRIFAVQYKTLRKRLLSTSRKLEIGPGPQGDRTFACESDAPAQDQNLYQIVIDPDDLADCKEAEHFEGQFLSVD